MKKEIVNTLFKNKSMTEELEDLSSLSDEDLELLRIFEAGLKGKYNGNSN